MEVGSNRQKVYEFMSFLVSFASKKVRYSFRFSKNRFKTAKLFFLCF